jgi:hypothetical protein
MASGADLLARAVRPDHAGLAVDHGRVRDEGFEISDDARHAGRPVVAALRVDPDLTLVHVALSAVAVVLDLVLPPRPGRHLVGQCRLGRRGERHLEEVRLSRVDATNDGRATDRFDDLVDGALDFARFSGSTGHPPSVSAAG